MSEQRADNHAVANREGWSVVESFRDNDRSASRFATKPRPAYLQLIEFVRAGRCEAVVVWELSRLSRDLGTLVAFRDLCRARGVLWSVGGRTYDPADERDTLPLIIQACQAEGESAQTSKRVLRAVTTTAEAGRPHGRLTYGYRREYDPTTKAFLRQVINDDEAAILREVADRFLSGEAFWSLARELTERKVPTPAAGKMKTAGATWHPTNLARLLKNPAYIGQRMRNGQYVADAVWPPIFTATQWSALQAKLTDPERSTRKESAVRHLLSGLPFCGVCKGQHVQSRKQRGGYGSYQCIDCFGVAIKEDWVDEYVTRKIIERLSAPDAADMFATDQDESTVTALRAELDEKRARLKEFEDAAGVTVSAAAFGRIEARLAPEIEALEVELQRAQAPAPLRHLVGVDVAAVWGAMTIPERREIIRHLTMITLHPPGRGRRTFSPESVDVEFRRMA